MPNKPMSLLPFLLSWEVDKDSPLRINCATLPGKLQIYKDHEQEPWRIYFSQQLTPLPAFPDKIDAINRATEAFLWWAINQANTLPAINQLSNLPITRALPTKTCSDCKGIGKVPYGYYGEQLEQNDIGQNRPVYEICRKCHGLGAEYA